MGNPFFSIIIPSFNRANLLKQTLEGFQQQVFQDFELIVVDDGSTDNTGEVIKGLNDSRVRYIYQENKERGAARNLGVSQAKGNYITFFDSDDIVYPNHLAEAYKFIKNESAILFVNSYQLINSTGKVIQTINHIAAPTPYLQLAYNNTLSIVLFFKNELAERIRFSENRNFIIGEDLLYLLKAGLLAELKHNPVITFGVRVHEKRTMASVPADKMEYSLSLFLKELEDTPGVRKKLGSKATRKLKEVMIINCALYIASFRQHKAKSLYLFAKSFTCNPFVVFQKKFLVYSRNLFLNWFAS